VAEVLPKQQEGRGLPDDAVVVRHGCMLLGDLRKTAQTCFDIHGVYGVSVSAHEEWSVEEIARASHLSHASICTTTAGELRAAGFEVEFTFSGNHATIKLPTKPDDELLQRLQGVFGSPEANPK